jgi:D-ribose pyranase
MKRTGILNRDLSSLVAAMGHYDRLVVSDAGFPIPKGVPCIDLTMGANSPTVLEVLKVIALELEVEQFYFANEILPSPEARSLEIQGIFPKAKTRVGGSWNCTYRRLSCLRERAACFRGRLLRTA